MQVFISYARKDAKWATKIAAWLSRAKVSYFLDQDELYPGDNWQLKIGQALEASQGMVVLVSPDYVSSDFARAELEFALGQPQFEWRVFPVLIRPTPKRKIPWIFNQFQMLDATHDPEQAEEQLVSMVRKKAKLLKKAEAAAHA